MKARLDVGHGIDLSAPWQAIAARALYRLADCFRGARDRCDDVLQRMDYHRKAVDAANRAAALLRSL